MSYKITKADLIGNIKNFPIEVVEKMLERQAEQVGYADVKLFQRSRAAKASYGGFTWECSEEGHDFWYDVIVKQNFDIFFDKYPKGKNHYVYIYQDGTKKGSDIIETLKSRGGNNESKICGDVPACYYYIHPTTKSLKYDSRCSDTVPWFKTFYTEIDVEPSIKEYTMQEIADKLGIDVASLRIKK